MNFLAWLRPRLPNGDLDGRTAGELEDAALGVLWPTGLTSTPWSARQAKDNLVAIAEWRKRVVKMDDRRAAKAYKGWLDFAERRQHEELKAFSYRERVKQMRIPRP